uniref:Uncharacterized protein n=1 Tax=Arundo donax TaxID=35708 RepID=A0A0A9A326_ARUDO
MCKTLWKTSLLVFHASMRLSRIDEASELVEKICAAFGNRYAQAAWSRTRRALHSAATLMVLGKLLQSFPQTSKGSRLCQLL